MGNEQPAQNEVGAQQSAPGGVFIMRGTTPRIPAGGLVITFDSHGILTARANLQLRLDVCPLWLEISEEHLSMAQSASADLVKAADANNEKQIGEHLERELKSSMQSIVAAATAVDSFYAALKEHIGLDSATKAAWQAKGLARHKQVAEVFRRACRIKPRNVVGIRKALKLLYDYRDNCVHPDHSFADVVLHPEARRNVERRFATYRYQNTRNVASVGIAFIAQACQAPSASDAVAEQCRSVAAMISPILEQWERHHGPVYERRRG